MDTNLLGWDVRLIGVTNGSPQLTICRDILPGSQGGGWYFPVGSTSWPSGQELGGNLDWTGCGDLPMVVVGMGNPLQAGTYYIGVLDPNNSSSYTLESRGIGLANYSIPVRTLALTGSMTNLALPVGEADYYQIVVTNNTPDWKLHVSATAGEVLLKVQENWLPCSDDVAWWANYGLVYGGRMGQLMMKPGDEQWALLPSYNNGTNLLPGTYYAVVASQGQNLTNGGCGYGDAGGGWGTGSASYTLSSVAEAAAVLPDTLSYGTDLLFTNAQAGGEMKFYQFNVPLGIASIEVRLENRVGNPEMLLSSGTNLVGTSDTYPYGNYGGTNWLWRDGSLITVANPGGPFNLTVYGADDGSRTYPGRELCAAGARHGSAAFELFARTGQRWPDQRCVRRFGRHRTRIL